MKKSWPAWFCNMATPWLWRLPFLSRTGAWSAWRTSRLRATSRSLILCRPPRPIWYRKPSSPISPSVRQILSTCVTAKKEQPRKAYDGVAVAVPVTVPYVRYSIRAAHWWLARAFSELLKTSGLNKHEVDGLTVSSFTLAPDTAIGLTQHLGLSPRWLDHIPMGGACGVVALRRAARAVQNGDADVVACVAGDTNHVDSFRQNLSNFSRFARDAVYPLGGGGPNGSFALLTAYYMRQYGIAAADFGKLCVAQRDNAQKF